MAIVSGPSEVLSKLKAFLLANTSLKKCFDGFPLPSQKIEYPSCSIMISSTNFMPSLPYVFSKGTLIATGADAGKTPIRRVVGTYDFKLQLDLWADTKQNRYALWEEFIKAFNKTEVPGISFQLTNYFNDYAHASLSDFQFLDSEPGSQRDEWRIKLVVIADCLAIVEENSFLIETVENNLETPQIIEADVELSSSSDMII